MAKRAAEPPVPHQIPIVFDGAQHHAWEAQVFQEQRDKAVAETKANKKKLKALRAKLRDLTTELENRKKAPTTSVRIVRQRWEGPTEVELQVRLYTLLRVARIVFGAGAVKKEEVPDWLQPRTHALNRAGRDADRLTAVVIKAVGAFGVSYQERLKKKPELVTMALRAPLKGQSRFGHMVLATISAVGLGKTTQVALKQATKRSNWVRETY